MTPQKHKPKFGLCIDWETSGSDWDHPEGSHIKYQGLSYGAVVFDANTFDVIDTLYREVKFDDSKYSWSKEAEAIHGLTREHLEKNGVSREDAAIDLAELIAKYFGIDGKIMFCGHNAEFDIQFTRQLLESFDIPVRKHHVVLDTSGAGFITFGLYKSDLLFDKLGFGERGAHNALEDALITVEVCKIMKNLMAHAYADIYES